MRRLLTVEDAFDLQFLGVVMLLPPPSQSLADEFPFPGTWSMPVQLRHPDGSVTNATASLSWPHFNPSGFKLMCALRDVEKADVPAGVEVWYEPGTATREAAWSSARSSK